jgi:hypothetical protein
LFTLSREGLWLYQHQYLSSPCVDNEKTAWVVKEICLLCSPYFYNNPSGIVQRTKRSNICKRTWNSAWPYYFWKAASLAQSQDLDLFRTCN